MKMSRRKLLLAAGPGAAASAVAVAQSTAAPGHARHEGPDMPALTEPARFSAPRDYQPVRTLNGWTLPYVMKGGVKEFHLVAEECEHEFAPGCKASVGIQRHDARPND